MNYPHVITACLAYADRFGNPKSVFYPGCGSDSSPSRVFRGASIVYCDPYKPGLEEIARDDPRAVIVNQAAENLPPGARYDLVLNVHSQGPFDAQIRDLRRGGHLLIMNKMSEQAFASSELMFVAVMVLRGDAMTVEETDLEKYFELEPAYKANPKQPQYGFTNGRLHKAPFYVFCKK